MHRSATLPRWHDVRQKTFQTLMVLNNVSIIVDRSKMTDVAAMVIEE
jgi:hypothetical protein